MQVIATGGGGGHPPTLPRLLGATAGIRIAISYPKICAVNFETALPTAAITLNLGAIYLVDVR